MQAIPSTFLDKSAIDNTIAALKSSPIISWADASKAIKLQRELRRKCAIALAIHKVDPIGGGAPMAMAA